MKHEKEDLEKRIKQNEEQKKKLKKENASSEQLEKLIKETKSLEIEKKELLQKEKQAPWNVDTISQPKFSKTIINTKEETKNYDEMNEEEKEQHMKKFIKENEKIIKEYGILRRFDDSKKYLMEHNLLVHEDTGVHAFFHVNDSLIHYF